LKYSEIVGQYEGLSSYNFGGGGGKWGRRRTGGEANPKSIFLSFEKSPC